MFVECYRNIFKNSKKFFRTQISNFQLILTCLLFSDISGCKAGRDLFTNEPAIAEFKLPDSIPPSERNVKFMESYAALSLLWTVSSIFLLGNKFVIS